MLTELETAVTYLDEVDAKTSVKSVWATENVAEIEYSKKLHLLRGERETMRSLYEPVTALVSGFKTFDQGAYFYRDHQFESAANQFYSATADFRDAHEAFEKSDPTDSLSWLVDELVCVAHAMAEGTEHLRKSADAGVDENDSRRRNANERAHEVFDSCETVKERVEVVDEV